MKTQETKNNVTGQGSSNADRAYVDAKETQKQKGISNGGGQRSDQTSNKDNTRKHENKH
ncbi:MULTISPECIES: hypothetical protein [unclassified Mucilaginibacter]|uniref:hypothetical protein n=1 Tax=unclassified Mucilaginibacter TaxID=2617802 RepID=UPI002AC8E374|nr:MULTISPECIES: hypothetical protein [unclassified Mucilaginibacter]MEB0261415.1 hypothetical protein [Mucilaginibacter sp. 10I4]MEB0278826.1 hypothetical protein [Mucilaginibacter sp. 10B2]MEB0299809.1 hypothetical protein [Mucilaginibacter sp. 5C4]WPX22008.1 hypothetical protein RHM67_12030 [Mucilaginibacter sp. 5C4]